ncbi:DUF4041 domain-containing protein [Flavobacterium sediminilitoris]|uniref:DUF4041 domain-containing protein n=1 Tax=Flavobacterium sediminilitoris TaxID=2024526 RepID=A0ABY4HN77_9FLAO|nr:MULTISPECIES: DUF4041 domain-containing protein [Flavobacterium]UOX34316.1 DUF4041 domain-containing protein [Flavobacterium sediminilitoris]
MGLFDFFKKRELLIIEELKAKLDRYKSIIDIEEETINKKEELKSIINEKENELNIIIDSKSKIISDLDIKVETLNSDYKEALETYKKLRKEVNLYESKLDLIEFGIYEPVYDFDKSEQYRIEQQGIIEKQKELVRLEKAAKCTINWTIDGSVTKGKANTKKFIKLVLRAFNGECSSFIAKVKWNNVNQMKERIIKSYEAINKLGENSAVFIEKEYLDLKIKELILEYEFQAKRQQEKEELRAIQEELREEEKARREFEQAQKEAEKDEINYKKALDKARKEIGSAIGDKHDKLLEHIEKLEKELLEAQEKKERALSMAQQTKRGHVYIISNIGSFGENVYKIGMTRRLEPLDRVKELGDASVPFKFDVHAMIYSDEAPTLENELHKTFADRKVNMLNYRKEFFNVSLNEIEQKISQLGFDAEFIKLPEAMEYRETLSIIQKIKNQEPIQTVEEQILNEFPISLK